MVSHLTRIGSEMKSDELPKSMMAHLVTSFTETSKSAMAAHELNEFVDKTACAPTMVTHMPNVDNENFGSSAISHSVISARGFDGPEYSDATNLVSHITKAGSEISSDELSKSILAHWVSSFTETFKSAMTADEVNESVDKNTFVTTMVAHMPNVGNEDLGSSAVSHSVVGAREKQRERSISLESDTIEVEDVEEDTDEDGLYSSDEEWKYEKKMEVEMDYFKRTKTIKKHKMATKRDVLKKERQIMEEILKNDIKNINELDDELLGLLSLQEKGDNIIESTMEESVFMTEIKDSEESKHQANTIEVMDIVKEEKGEYVKASLIMKCNCSNEKKISVCTCKDVDDGKEDLEIILSNSQQDDAEALCAPQNVKFQWKIKVSNNWLEHGNLQDVEINSNGDLILDLQNINPGSYKYKFLINQTSFCDETLPFEQNYFGSTNVFIMWSNNFTPAKAKSVTINAQITLPWKVQIVGSWSAEPKTIDCKVCTNGDVVARLPALQPGSYKYKFLINSCQFVDESLPLHQEYLGSCNLLVVRDSGDVVLDEYAEL
eukprot:GFUD01094776.1.p1 GENE.GFUD01094776.1~~GFUD01094776.1.p1  ORF type:complete len:643 (-),score=181.87 GFUD01094776.1:41-1684(-)